MRGLGSVRPRGNRREYRLMHEAEQSGADALARGDVRPLSEYFRVAAERIKLAESRRRRCLIKRQLGGNALRKQFTSDPQSSTGGATPGAMPGDASHRRRRRREMLGPNDVLARRTRNGGGYG